MKMTIDEFLACPQGMRLEEWEKILQEQKKIKNKIRRLSIERDDLTDALEILSDEQGSDRYQKKEQRLNKVEEEIRKLCTRLKEI